MLSYCLFIGVKQLLRRGFVALVFYTGGQEQEGG